MAFVIFYGVSDVWDSQADDVILSRVIKVVWSYDVKKILQGIDSLPIDLLWIPLSLIPPYER